MSLDKLLEKFAAVANNPNAYLVDWKERTGKVAIGGIAPFPPEEIIYAAGALPVTMWGADIEPNDAYKFYPAFYCSVVTTVTQLALQGSYRELAAVVCNCCCDSLNDLMENWKSAIDIPIIECVYPQNRKIEPAKYYMVKDLRLCAEKVEKITEHKITDLDLQHTIHLFNAHRQAMREFSLVAGDHLDVITPLVRRNVFKSAHFMDKAEHLEWVRALIEALKKRPVYLFDGVRVVSTGIMIDSTELMNLLEKNKIGIVGDDVVAESKRYEVDVNNGIDLYYQLADRWSRMEGCSLLYDPSKKRGTMLAEMAKQRSADGVLVCLLKFCEMEEYDYPILRKVFKKAELPELFLEVEATTGNDEQAGTRIQAFCEMLGK
ncbi:2-hydroxyacyl-CoA dehydratase subunit D [Eubacterium barkeri]|uniref:Benzoyl-CoA reductase/2-hydroxyglutaryl-CoA dehydratase subunit, BcrC/BadD/HgdB n=1 Tax=Eubacterium barkeri TaxID=1528 RepID=A0A1H3I4W9_EUBBA|nr:2-hydroxyacyl-CoA dehydratase family protein [Eubacterium barkeri]SDY22672.1 Benzoyl-CoA reductase/2-hydroxyglutaryl-CoA dehydratase subunit, BcrC/BadD/HgdB [Eubacterium barkeri]